MSSEKIRHMVLARTLIFIFRGDELLVMKYSGKGGDQNQEKSDRKDMYNLIGGHIELGEDVISSAQREAHEEAGIRIVNPKVRGIIHIQGYAHKNIMNFIITGTTNDTPVTESLEGQLEWVQLSKLETLNIFEDVKLIVDALATLEPDETLVGTATYDNLKLLELNLKKA